MSITWKRTRVKEVHILLPQSSTTIIENREDFQLPRFDEKEISTFIELTSTDCLFFIFIFIKTRLTLYWYILPIRTYI